MTVHTFTRRFLDGSSQQIEIEFDTDDDTGIPFAGRHAKVTYGPRVPADIKPTPLVRSKPEWVGGHVSSEPDHDTWIDTLILFICAAILTAAFSWMFLTGEPLKCGKNETSTGNAESLAIPTCKMDVEQSSSRP